MEEEIVKKEENNEEVVKQEENLEKKPSNNKKTIIILLLIILLLICAVVYLLFIRKPNDSSDNNESNNQQVNDNENKTIGVYENTSDTELQVYELDENNKEFKLNGKSILLKNVNESLYINNKEPDDFTIGVNKVHLRKNYIIIEGGGQNIGYPYILNEDGKLIKIEGGIPDNPLNWIDNLRIDDGKLVATKNEEVSPTDPIRETKVEIIYDGSTAKVVEATSSNKIISQSNVSAIEAANGIVKLLTDFPQLMPLYIKGEKPSSYSASDLSAEKNSNILFMYAYIIGKDEESGICKMSNYSTPVGSNSNECFISVSAFSSRTGLNIGNNFKKDDYVKGIVKEDGVDYYRVLLPITGWELPYEIKNCKTNKNSGKLTVSCDIYEIINHYEPYEEKKIGTGEFIYKVADNFTFEKFVFSSNNTPTPKPVTNTSSFKYVEDNFGLASYGYAYVNGYVEVVNDSVSFHITNTDSNDFKKTMETLGYTNNTIPLGCVKDGIISFETGADEFGPSNYTGAEEDAFKYFMKTISLSSDVSSKIINSNSSNPIILKMSKFKLTHYMNLYDACRTSITNVELVK